MSLANIHLAIDEINSFLRTKLWMDFEVSRYLDHQLTIIGSVDPSSHHDIEIVFDGVAFVSFPIEWKTDTTKIVLTMVNGSEARELNMRFQVEIGHHIFRFAPEYYPADFSCLIGAKTISYEFPSK